MQVPGCYVVAVQRLIESQVVHDAQGLAMFVPEVRAMQFERSFVQAAGLGEVSPGAQIGRVAVTERQGQRVTLAEDRLGALQGGLGHGVGSLSTGLVP